MRHEQRSLKSVLTAVGIACVVMISPTKASAVQGPTCRDLFAFFERRSDFERAIEKLVLDLKNKSPIDGLSTARELKKETQRQFHIYEQARSLLAQKGIQSEIISTQNDGFMPEQPLHLLLKFTGDSHLAKVARKLNERGIEVALSLEVLQSAMGAYGEGRIYIDVKSISDMKMSAVMAHEIRHAMDAAWARESNRDFERVFLNRVDASLTEAGLLPAATGASSYRSYFSLDEILAHRMSSALAIRDFKHKKNRGEDPIWEKLRFRREAGRYTHFVKVWKETASLVERELDLGGVAFSLHDADIGAGFKEMSVHIVERERRLKDFLHRSKQDEKFVDLRLSFVVSGEVAAALKTPAQMKTYTLNWLRRTSHVIGKIEPAINNFEAAVARFNGESVAEMETTLSQLSRALAEARKGL